MPDGGTSVPAVVVGIGQDDRSDDRIGLEIARELARDPTVPAQVVAYPGELTGLLELWKGRRLAVVIDAVRSSRAAGTIVRWEWGKGPPPPLGPTLSSHAVSLAHVVELGVAVGAMPERLVLFGVEAERFDLGGEMSRAVGSARAKVVALVRQELARTAGPEAEAAHA